jgi:AraC-like DNA-binding protein
MNEMRDRYHQNALNVGYQSASHFQRSYQVMSFD